jgi:hypothetical protein
MASPMLCLFPRFHPPDCPRQFKPLFAVTRVVQVSRVIRIERPDDHLGFSIRFRRINSAPRNRSGRRRDRRRRSMMSSPASPA